MIVLTCQVHWFDDTIKNNKALGKRNGYMNFKSKQRKKKHMCSFSKHSKNCIIRIKKKNEPFFLKKELNSMVLSLCFSESYPQPGSMSEPENIAVFANLTWIFPQDFEILGWCPAGTFLPQGEKVPL